MRTQGAWAEQQACDFLQSHGVRLIDRNVHCRFGEIDLIMQQGEQLLFIEVKYRQRPGFGGAAASVTASKQRKIRLTAQWYLQQKTWGEPPCRFDVVAIDGEQINWIQDAF
ncbi:YraN family protein [Ferrimonas gelatinilytica]|uniref:UPF0102 protein GCM10025772_27170 n=1 Tax=Ferrimonas gelatinilytica TaxID=1255257 RepID=A0ABP9SEN2_9GAMM